MTEFKRAVLDSGYEERPRAPLYTNRRNLTLAPAPLPSFAAHFKQEQMLMTIQLLTDAWAQRQKTPELQVG